MADPRESLLYEFGRLQWPGVRFTPTSLAQHVQRTIDWYRRVHEADADFPHWLEGLYAADWILAAACLDGQEAAWDALFASRTGRTDMLLVDALRQRAARFHPRDPEAQDSAVAEFWSRLIAPTPSGGLPILARFDGHRPLIPWLIRVFVNAELSGLKHADTASSGDAMIDDLAAAPPPATDDRWHEPFRRAARDWIGTLKDQQRIVLGLLWRYRVSQRAAAARLQIHEGTLSRQVDGLSRSCHDFIRSRLEGEGWTGDDLDGYLLKEIGSVLTDDPRLSADELARLLKQRGVTLSEAPVD